MFDGWCGMGEGRCNWKFFKCALDLVAWYFKKLAERRAENWELRIDNVWWIRVEIVRKWWGKKGKNIVWGGQKSNFLKIYIVVSTKNRKFAAIESGGRAKPVAGANVIERLKTRVIWCWQQKNTKASDATQMSGDPKIWSSNERKKWWRINDSWPRRIWEGSARRPKGESQLENIFYLTQITQKPQIIWIQ